MKNLLIAGALFTLPVATATAGTARLQVIHNAADPSAAVVDVYVNGSLLLDDFAFRTATPFVEVPSDVDLTVGIAQGSSTSAADVLASFPVRLADRGTYVAIASGVLNPGGFSANPEGSNIGFSIYPRGEMRTRSSLFWLVNAIAFHGATDAPAVDILAKTRLGSLKLVGDLSYGEYSSYKFLLPVQYRLQVTPAGMSNTVVAEFEADLSSLRGGAAVVFASGFLTPAANQIGPAFGLFAALPNGTVVEFPRLDIQPGTARLQVIHNAADPAAEVVDIYVNGDLLLNDFAFRTATPFVDVPAGVVLNIGVAPGTSGSAADVIATFPVTLERDEAYVAIASGVLSGSGFATNPEGRSIGFSVYPRGDVRTKMPFGWVVGVLAFHGATDAPSVDVVTGSKWFRTQVADDLGFGEYSNYRALLPHRYRLDVTPAGNNQAVIASFDADLRELGGGTAVVFASGFLSSADNQNGPAFGLFAALPTGTVVEFPRIDEPQFARLQVIHNAADPAAAEVDVYVNGNLLLNDFAFRTATPFVDVPAGVVLNIGIAPGTSGSAADVIATFPVTLTANEKYVVVANGVLAPGNFEANPDGRSTAFSLIVKDMAREVGSSGGGSVDLAAVHGATDAPMVDVIARGVATLVDNAAYGDITDYFTVPAGSYTLDVTPGGDNAVVVASYTADLSGLGGGAAIVFASGFLSPENDQDGAAFGLYAALPTGTVVALAVAPAPPAPAAKAGDLLPADFALEQNYPNPFNPTTMISFALPRNAQVRLAVYNVLGQEVRTLLDREMAAGTHAVQFDGDGLSSGVYFYRLETDSFRDTRKMMLVK